MSVPSSPRRPRRIPLAVKLAYTACVAVLVPFYLWAYGPTNFLYFCDVALLLTLAAVWTEQPLPAGMAAVGILVPQLLWVADFLAELFGGHITGMTAYMFRVRTPEGALSPYLLFVRGLSLFHGWLPFFLLYLVYRLGYDRLSLLAWTLLAWALMLVCFFLMPPPPAPADDPDKPVNINYVYGPGDEKPQEWMSELQWLALLMAAYPAIFFVPAHFFLLRMPVWSPPGGGDENAGGRLSPQPGGVKLMPPPPPPPS
jgi:hypothetical protein